MRNLTLIIFALCFLQFSDLKAQSETESSLSFGIPTNSVGIGFGNSPKFSGIRFNIMDKHVEQINGINVTFWNHKENTEAVVNGISLGVLPTAGTLRSLNIGILGVAADKNMSGLNIAGLGLGAGQNLNGISIAGLGIGSGNQLNGIALAGMGLGSGGDMNGLFFGGLGVGAGGSLSGIVIGGLGVGAENLLGISL